MNHASDPLADIKSRLHNWARWSRHDCLPNLDAKLSALWSQWIPKQAWDTGWGDVGAPEERSKDIDNRDAELIDHHLVWLTMVHRSNDQTSLHRPRRAAPGTTGRGVPGAGGSDALTPAKRPYCIRRKAGLTYVPGRCALRLRTTAANCGYFFAYRINDYALAR